MGSIFLEIDQMLQLSGIYQLWERVGLLKILAVFSSQYDSMQAYNGIINPASSISLGKAWQCG